MIRAGQGLILLTLTLLIFGVIMVTSAGQTVGSETASTIGQLITGRPVMYALVALFALLLGACLPVQKLARWEGIFGFLSPIRLMVIAMIVLLLLVHVPGLSREMNGSSRWLNLGGLSVQPSELAKWGMILVLAWHCARQKSAMQTFTHGFLPAIWIVGIICALIAIEDLGTAVLIGMVSMAVLISGGARIWHVATMIPVGILGFIAAVWQNPYRADRLLAYLDPYQDPQGIGYHVVQSMAAVSGGGIAGHGLGNGVRKFGYVPEDTTDFIFAIICEELGIFGAAFVIFLYAAILLCGLLIIRKTTSTFGRLVVTGVVFTIGLQAAINMAVVTGVAPTKGIALPLLSHGGTGWALTAFSIGMLVSIDRTAAAEDATHHIAVNDSSTMTKRLKTPRVQSISPAAATE